LRGARFNSLPRLYQNAIADKLGEATEKDFILADPNIQVFEKNPKEPKTT
jgi:hypothetical protein